MAFETCNPVESYSFNNVLEEGQDDLQVPPIGLATPPPMPYYRNNSSPPNLAIKSSYYPTTVVFENVGFAPLLPDMFANEEAAPRRENRPPFFKVQPRFAALRTEMLPMLHQAIPSMMDAVSSDEEEEESSPGDVASFTALSLEEEGDEEEDSLASLSSMETSRQERLDSLRKTAKVSPKKKVLHVKQPAPQRPALRTQPRRNSFSAIAA